MLYIQFLQPLQACKYDCCGLLIWVAMQQGIQVEASCIAVTYDIMYTLDSDTLCDCNTCDCYRHADIMRPQGLAALQCTLPDK